MTTNNGWPGKPGVPLSPEKDGWHWISGDGGDPEPFYWNGIWQGSDQFSYYSLDESCRYLGPCLTPDEAAALQKRVAELRKIIRYVAGCEHATASDEDLLEQVAAAICRMNDIDPTGHISIDGSPFNWAWQHFLPQARAALGEKE